MTDPSDARADPQAAIAACLDDLAANVPAKEVFARLREIDGRLATGSVLRARFLLARGIANNRLGLRGEALGDLHEARRLIEDQPERGDLARVLRAIAVVHTWHGEWRDATMTMLDAIAESTRRKDFSAIAQALIEAGRLQIEIGRPTEAQFLLTRALLIGGPDLPVREREHAAIVLLQALGAAKLVDEARSHLAAVRTWLRDAIPRLRLLAEIEAARIAIASNDLAAARSALVEAVALVPADADCFERVEVAHAEAEVALAAGDSATAAKLLDDVVARYADDDLAGREVVARLLQAEAYDRLGRTEQAERALAAALRRALARGLSGHADLVRSRMAARGSVEDAWHPGEAPAGSAPRDVTDRFVRQRIIASGGYGTVMRAYDLELGIEVAVKRMKLADLYDTRTRDRLITSAQTEVAAASRIAHPGIARVHGLMLEPSGDALVIEELIEGPTLHEAMGKPMTLARALDIVARIAQALAAVHGAGVIHRDLKPENIILRAGTAPVIVDFGIALIAGRRADPAGTRGYMAPEQAQGHAVDARADLYSLGVITYQMLTGELPDVPPPSRLSVVSRLFSHWREKEMLICAKLDRDLADLVMHMLAPSPRRRPASTAQVAAQLSAAASRQAAQGDTLAVTRRLSGGAWSGLSVGKTHLPHS